MTAMTHRWLQTRAAKTLAEDGLQTKSLHVSGIRARTVLETMKKSLKSVKKCYIDNLLSSEFRSLLKYKFILSMD